MKTKKQIQSKIKSITKEYSKLPQYSMFGDNNWRQRDIMLGILSQALKQGKDWIDEQLEKMKDYYDGNFPEDEAEKRKIDTLDWLMGNIDEL